MRTQLLLLLVLSIGIALSIPLFLGGSSTLSLLAYISPAAIMALLAIVALSWLFNAARIFLLLRGAGHALGFRATFIFILACDFSVKATPAGIGGPITAIAVLSKYNIHPTRTVAAFSLLFALDVALVFIFFAILYLVSYQQWSTTAFSIYIAATAIFSVIALLALLKLPLYYRRFVHFLGRPLYTFSALKRLRYPLARQFIAVKKGCMTLLALSAFTRLQIVGCSLAFWLAQFSILYCCLHFTGEAPSWAIVATIQLLAMVAGRLTLLPAGAGGIEATSIALLSLWVEPDTAAASVLLWRSTTLFPALIAGSLAMLTLGIRLETAKSASPTKPASYPY